MKLIWNSWEIVEKIWNKVIKTWKWEAFNNQLSFLLQNNDDFIKIKKINDEKYEMDFIKTRYIDFIKNNNLEDNIKKFNELIYKILNYSKENNWKNNIKKYIDKLEQRTWIKFSNYEHIKLINDIWFVHWDLTVSNIMINDNNEIVFIDPKWTNESTYYDWWKLLQSFCMNYENVIENNNDKIPVYNDFKNILYEKFDEKLLDFYLAVHLIWAYPFFKSKNRPYTIDFLKKWLDLFTKLWIKYEMTNISLMSE